MFFFTPACLRDAVSTAKGAEEWGDYTTQSLTL